MMSRYLKSILVNMIPILPILIGLNINNEFLIDFGIYLLWGVSIVGILVIIIPNEVFLTKESIDRMLSKATNKIYIWGNVIYDIAVAFFVAYLGYPFLGVVYLVHILGYTTLFKAIREHTAT